MALILASASPRRHRLLEALGVGFEVVVPEVEELTAGDPAAVVIENARRKARAGLGLAAAGSGDLVLGVDTEVALDGAVLGKPDDERAARASLEALSGRTHEVLSGVVVLAGGAPEGAGRRFGAARGEGEEGSAPASPGERVGVARTEVTFRRLEPATIELYLRSGEWRDRAGGYAIQGLGSILVAALQGDFSNVVGLPLALLLELAPELGKG